ncbi:hypothetical protein B0H17DRAFT_1137247 [Mycena rosella]|uniref:Uncharacterized protein n=1 Tax=Mycena rosella TaxID=1033263 RepID=A0AAD7DAD8_MYCRO|nr:hypothetical protein B0H17DRAFT_1137247 [Mycena rosella]
MQIFDRKPQTLLRHHRVKTPSHEQLANNHPASIWGDQDIDAARRRDQTAGRQFTTRRVFIESKGRQRAIPAFRQVKEPRGLALWSWRTRMIFRGTRKVQNNVKAKHFKTIRHTSSLTLPNSYVQTELIKHRTAQPPENCKYMFTTVSRSVKKSPWAVFFYFDLIGQPTYHVMALTGGTWIPGASKIFKALIFSPVSPRSGIRHPKCLILLKKTIHEHFPPDPFNREGNETDERNLGLVQHIFVVFHKSHGLVQDPFAYWLPPPDTFPLLYKFHVQPAVKISFAVAVQLDLLFVYADDPVV